MGKKFSGKNTASKTPSLRIEKKSFYKMIYRRVFMWVKVSLAVLLGVYLVGAFFIVRFLFLPGTGVVFVKDTQFKGNFAPQGSYVYYNEGYNSISFVTDKFFVLPSDLSLVKIEAGPVGKVSYDENGVITRVGSQDVSIEGLADENITALKDQYIVECVSGACAEQDDKTFIIRKEAVVGEDTEGPYVNDDEAVHEDFKE